MKSHHKLIYTFSLCQHGWAAVVLNKGISKSPPEELLLSTETTKVPEMGQLFWDLWQNWKLWCSEQDKGPDLQETPVSPCIIAQMALIWAHGGTTLLKLPLRSFCSIVLKNMGANDSQIAVPHHVQEVALFTLKRSGRAEWCKGLNSWLYTPMKMNASAKITAASCVKRNDLC